MTGLMLLVIAIIVLFIVGVPVIVLSTIISLSKNEGNLYYKDLAIGVDHFGNVLISPVANLIIIKRNSNHKFGNIKETISRVLAHNFKNKTCTKFGLVICNILEYIDKGHLSKSISN